jgi:simple sugar transport system ATP-binding protein
MTTEKLLVLRGATKRYGGVAALDDVDFDLAPGEVHAIVGENGAGKSTLCKIIAGVILPDAGEFLIEGEPTAIANPLEAYNLGISMVFQETSLVPQLTVAQNLVLGRERAVNSIRRLKNEARQLLRSLNFNVNPDALAGSLSAAQRQMVEIARAVYNKSRIVILDEPTATLTPEETEHLFYLMSQLKADGVSLVFISHALEEALEQADRITVLRNGQHVRTDAAGVFDRAALIADMIGTEAPVTEQTRRSSKARRASAPILKVEGLRYANIVNNMSFSIYPGEVTGIAGLIGSGRSETAKLVAGELRRNFGGGTIQYKGRAVTFRRPAAAVKRGIAYVTEDRKLNGFYETMSVTDNIATGWLARHFGKNLLLRRQEMKALGRRWLEKVQIRMLKDNQKVLRLSGGNQQKVVIAKSLVQAPDLVIFDEPTRGVDVGAIVEIRQMIRDLADSGTGVIVISSYLPEILDLSDRILIARGGTIVAEFDREEASSEKVLHAAIH